MVPYLSLFDKIVHFLAESDIPFYNGSLPITFRQNHTLLAKIDLPFYNGSLQITKLYTFWPKSTHLSVMVPYFLAKSDISFYNDFLPITFQQNHTLFGRNSHIIL